MMDPAVYNEIHTRPALEEKLELIISATALVADSFCTRDDRREKIVSECNAVRQALQDLLSEYMSNVSAHGSVGSLRVHVERECTRSGVTRGLATQVWTQPVPAKFK